MVNRLIHSFSCFSRCSEMLCFESLGQLVHLLQTDFMSALWQIDFVPQKRDWNVFWCIVFNFMYPALDRIKAFAIAHVIAQQHSVAFLVEGTHYTSEVLLSCSVPELDLDRTAWSRQFVICLVELNSICFDMLCFEFHACIARNEDERTTAE